MPWVQGQKSTLALKGRQTPVQRPRVKKRPNPSRTLNFGTINATISLIDSYSSKV
jgi:hypothetical protein